jgi:hypothetical protein
MDLRPDIDRAGVPGQHIIGPQPRFGFKLPLALLAVAAVLMALAAFAGPAPRGYWTAGRCHDG